MHLVRFLSIPVYLSEFARVLYSRYAWNTNENWTRSDRRACANPDFARDYMSRDEIVADARKRENPSERNRLSRKLMPSTNPAFTCRALFCKNVAIWLFNSRYLISRIVSRLSGWKMRRRGPSNIHKFPLCFFFIVILLFCSTPHETTADLLGDTIKFII